MREKWIRESLFALGLFLVAIALLWIFYPRLIEGQTMRGVPYEKPDRVRLWSKDQLSLKGERGEFLLTYLGNENDTIVISITGAYSQFWRIPMPFDPPYALKIETLELDLRIIAYSTVGSRRPGYLGVENLAPFAPYIDIGGFKWIRVIQWCDIIFLAGIVTLVVFAIIHNKILGGK